MTDIDLTQPVAVPAPSRPARIATMHAAGQYLADNPDLPMPTTVEMVIHGVRAERFRALADLYGAEVEERGNARWITIPVALETLHGIEIRYVAFEEN